MEQTRLAGTQNPAEVQSVCELVGAHSVGMEQAVSEIKTSPICGESSCIFTLTERNGIERYGIACFGGHLPKEYYDTEAKAIAAWNSEVRHEQ